MKEREFVVRFAIADERGARSSVWRIWKGRGKDDIYIAPRAIVSFAKGSVHASGLCYFSLTAQRHDQMVATSAAREKRAFTRWRRLPTPASGFVDVVSLIFAGEYLSKSGSPVELNTALIEAPKAGQAVVVDLVFGRTPGGGLFLQPNQHQL